jgi:hypothetical protein
MVPQQNAVERPSSCFEIGAVLGEDDLVDHGVDSRIFYSNQVA